MSFAVYENYRESGIEWIGSLPDAWDIQTIKRTSYLKGRVGWKGLTSDEYLEEGYAYLVTGSDFRSKFVRWDECYCVEEERFDDDPFIQLKNGDLLITKDGTIGKLAIVSGLDRPACLNSGIFLVRPTSGWNTDFLYWMLSSSVFSTFCDLASLGSTIQHLYQNVFERFAFPLPTRDEQVAIATFLDRETAKIDALVEEQRQLIERLKEKRQAVISYAVTKGLNPAVRMKCSGVEWLGDVPAHWEVGALKRNWTVTDCKHITADFVEDGIPLASIREVQSRYVQLGEAKMTTDAYYDLLCEGGRKPQPGDLIFSRNATVGAVAQVAEWHPPFAMGQDVCLLRKADPSQSTDFLQIVMQSGVVSNQLTQMMIGSTFKRVNVEQIRSITIPFPPADEQVEIAAMVQDLSQKHDSLIEAAEEGIGLLQERRAALISAAVTGQIDVRSAVIQRQAKAA